MVTNFELVPFIRETRLPVVSPKMSSSVCATRTIGGVVSGVSARVVK